MKFKTAALALLCGALLSACDKAETVPANNPSPNAQVADDNASKNLTSESQNAPMEQAPTAAPSETAASVAPAETAATKERAPVEAAATKERAPAAAKASEEKAQAKTVAKKVKKHSAYYQQQKALLNELEKQYKAVACPESAKELGEYSFCRQEERRLFLEIQRVQDDLRVNE